MGTRIICYHDDGCRHYPAVHPSGGLPVPPSRNPAYDELLTTCFNLIIGVELIRMMSYHTSDTVFEVLVFAIARQVIIGHSSAVSSLIGVCAIAVLFATRKFLFPSSGKLTKPDREQEEFVHEPVDE